MTYLNTIKRALAEKPIALIPQNILALWDSAKIKIQFFEFFKPLQSYK